MPQKFYSVDINTRKKKYKGKEHSHLEIAKSIELSGWAKRKKLQILYINIKLWTRFTVHTHARSDTQITIDKGKCTLKNWKIKYINEPVSSWR